jgi:hypothetical protein
MLRVTVTSVSSDQALGRPLSFCEYLETPSGGPPHASHGGLAFTVAGPYVEKIYIRESALQ